MDYFNTPFAGAKKSLEENALNIDDSIQKILNVLLKKWKFLLVFGIIGAIIAYAYTNQFTTLTYTSSVEFLAYVDDSKSELQDSSSQGQNTEQQRVSQTSKMNYAMKMLDTYIEVFQTTAFNEKVSVYLSENYGDDCSASSIRGSTSIEAVEETSMFKVKVTTTDPDLSYHIAQSLTVCIPESMANTNKGLVVASVEDPPLKAYSAESMNYPKKCLVGALAGIVLAAAFVIVKDMFDIRIRTANELSSKYEIPILGSVPYFDDTTAKTAKPAKTKKGGNK